MWQERHLVANTVTARWGHTPREPTVATQTCTSRSSEGRALKGTVHPHLTARCGDHLR